MSAFILIIFQISPNNQIWAFINFHLKTIYFHFLMGTQSIVPLVLNLLHNSNLCWILANKDMFLFLQYHCLLHQYIIHQYYMIYHKWCRLHQCNNLNKKIRINHLNPQQVNKKQIQLMIIHLKIVEFKMEYESEFNLFIKLDIG